MTSIYRFTPTATCSVIVALIVFLVGCSTLPVPQIDELKYSPVYFDLDGTALNDSGEVLQSTLEAVAAYKHCGGSVGIATGRILEQALSAIDALAPTLPVVLFNGAVVFDPATGKSTVLHNLSFESAQRVAVALHDLGMEDRAILHYATRSTVPAKSADRGSFAQEYGVTLTEDDPSIRNVSPELYEADPVVKILIVCEANEKERVKSLIASRLSKDERVIVSSLTTVEILPSLANKASAIFYAIRDHGLAMDQVVAFGDSGNDVEMLTQVGLGIAMAGCYPPTCDAADLIIGSNTSAAISKCLFTIVIPGGCNQSHLDQLTPEK